ncbi:MAG: bacterioferritin [Chloroflexota bacterium]
MNQKVIDALNAARAREITAITQYLAQHYELEDQMLGKLGDKIKEIGIVEMRHAEAFAERILFLGGVPISKPDVVALKSQTIPEMLQTDQGLEESAIKMYNDSAKLCDEEGDHVSKMLFERILAEEEDHLDDFQNIAAHVDKLGQSYIATLVG